MWIKVTVDRCLWAEQIGFEYDVQLLTIYYFLLASNVKTIMWKS
jgi:hypothetical protein